MTTRTIQVTLDDSLLTEVDRATQDLDTSRSALIRAALTSFLEELRTNRMEREHREAFERIPQSEDDFAFWEAIEAWEQA